MNAPRALVLSAMLCIAVFYGESAQAQGRVVHPLDQVTILVARPSLEHRLYRRSVLIVQPLGDEVHVGFILNKPARTVMSQKSLDDLMSNDISEKFYIGGPDNPRVVFALIEREKTLGKDFHRLTDELYVSLSKQVIDDLIEKKEEQARFVLGSVTWRSGELEKELMQGMWYVLQPKANMKLLRKEAGWLWHDLKQIAEAMGT